MSDDGFSEFADGYFTRLADAARAIDRTALARARDLIATLRTTGGCLLVAGNGGSAAIANHLECDATKGTLVEGVAPIRSRSLSANPSVLTAIANDIEFGAVFAKQIEMYARDGDVVLLVSSSGSSPNVIAACHAAKARRLPTIALVGFSGGGLAKLADVVVHVAVSDYGIVEDLHQSVLHLITQHLRAHPHAH